MEILSQVLSDDVMIECYFSRVVMIAPKSIQVPNHVLLCIEKKSECSFLSATDGWIGCVQLYDLTLVDSENVQIVSDPFNIEVEISVPSSAQNDDEVKTKIDVRASPIALTLTQSQYFQIIAMLNEEEEHKDEIIKGNETFKSKLLKVFQIYFGETELHQQQNDLNDLLEVIELSSEHDHNSLFRIAAGKIALVFKSNLYTRKFDFDLSLRDFFHRKAMFQ